MTIDPLSAGKSLVNIGDLSKPATTLIEKISDAIGGIAKPWQIERVAKAEAKAEIIRAESKIEISQIERRALARMVREEGKRQENIESITAQAIPLLSPESKPENVADDWLVHFFDKSRLISDAEMQSLWAKILAGEANGPGTFSKRTIDLVSALDKSDAQLFVKLCSAVWVVGTPVPMIFNTPEWLKPLGINFSDLTHLDSIGLIRFESISGFTLKKVHKMLPVYYHGRIIVIEFPDNFNKFEVGAALLTRAGLDLARICRATSSEEHFMAMLQRWLDQNYILSTPTLRRPAVL